MASFTFLPTEVVENVALSSRIYRIRFAAPEIAQSIKPGQFVMLRIANCLDPLLGRAFALYDIAADENGTPTFVDVVYQVHGKLTSQLKRLKPGDLVETWGPLGNGFRIPEAEHLIFVAGGIGQTPFVATAKQAFGTTCYGTLPSIANPPQKITMCYGARTEADFAGLEDFRAAGIDLQLCTEDGSLGTHGLVTELLENVIHSNKSSCEILCCGPERMMEAVAKVAAKHAIACQLSLETPMACGIGICFTCVAQVRQEDGTCDYKRTCVEGPVFDAASIVWG